MFHQSIEAAIQARHWNKAVQVVDLQDDNVAERSVITKRESLKTGSWVHELIDLLYGQNESDFQLAVMFCNIILFCFFQCSSTSSVELLAN